MGVQTVHGSVPLVPSGQVEPFIAQREAAPRALLLWQFVPWVLDMNQPEQHLQQVWAPWIELKVLTGQLRQLPVAPVWF